MLEFRQVRKAYDRTTPILDIESQVLDSGAYWLQGANGSGKTTLIRIIAGIVPFKGDTVIDGHSQRHEPVAYRRNVGWADAEPLFPEFLTGREIVNFYRGILNPDPGQVAGLTKRLIIGGWLDTRLGGWSSGMIKKLALLLAFLGHPAWILLDEPLITLDGPSLEAVLALITGYRDQYGTAFLLSSHQQLPTDRFPDTRSLILANRSICLIP